MEFLWIKYFIVTAQTQHMTQAAEKLMVSQSSLSKTISRLEDDLGVPLFRRRGRNIELNEYGEAFLESALKIESDLEDALALLNDIKGGTTGNIRVAINFPYMYVDPINDYIRNLVLKQPNIQTAFYELNMRDSLKWLEENKVDAVLTNGAIDSPEIDFELFFEEPLNILASRNNPIAQEGIVSLSRFAESKFLCNTSAQENLIHTTQMLCKKAGYNPNIGHIGNSVDLVGEAISRNLGVAFMSNSAFQFHFKNKSPEWLDQLILIPLKESFCIRAFGAATLKGRYINKLTKKFLHDLQKVYQNIHVSK